MSLDVRIGTAFRGHSKISHFDASDIVRVLDEGGVKLALLANGHECGFSTCWPPGSRMILDFFVDAWKNTVGPIQGRIDSAFEHASRRFASEAPALIMPDADFLDDPPGASLLVVAVEGARVHMAWIGADVAMVVRGFTSVVETTPHTLVEQFRREHPEILDLNEVPHVQVRSIRSGDHAPGPVDYFATDLVAGDTIVLLSKATTRGAMGFGEDVAFTAAAYSNPGTLAERLADLAFSGTESPYVAVAALRFDSVDVPSTIDRLIDAYVPDQDLPDWLREWSATHRALPVAFDGGGAFGMTRDGSILSVHWDDPTRNARAETSIVAHLAATLGAARNHPELATLAPRRPEGAGDCAKCAEVNSGGELGCPFCHHLGWSVPDPPRWFSEAPPVVSSDRTEPLAARTTTKRSWWQRFWTRPS